MAVRWRNIFTLSVSFLYLLSLSFGFITENPTDVNNSLISCVVSHIQKTESNKYAYTLGAQLNAQKNLSTYNVKLKIIAKCYNDVNCADKTLICTSNVQDIDNTFKVLQSTCDESNEDVAPSSTASEEATPDQTVPKEPSPNQEEPEKQLPRNEAAVEPSSGLDGSTEPVSGLGEPDSELSVEKTTVQLVHEVQPTNTETSGEQFVAVRRQVLGPGCSGCASQVDVDAPGVHELAVAAVKHIDRHQRDEKHSLVDILSVQRQVQIVNGVRYILYLNVAFDSCDRDFADASNCSELKLCKISILEKPWLKLSDGSRFRAVISNNCTDDYFFMDNEFLPTINSLPKIIEHAAEKFKSDQTLPDYDMIANSGKAEDILKVVKNKELQASSRDDNKISDDERLKSLEEQIIDGFKSNIEVSGEKKPAKDLKKLLADFDAQFTKINHENPKNNEIPSTESLNENQESNDRRYVNRKKRSVFQFKRQTLGAQINIPITAEIQQLANEAFEMIKSNTLYLHKVIRIKSATSQIVGGELTRIKFEVGPTDCLKSDAIKNLDDCQLQSNSQPVEYVAKVWERPWIPDRQVTIEELSYRNKRSTADQPTLRGAPKDILISDNVRAIAHEGLGILEGKSNSLYRQKVIRVKSATEQVVAGSLTKVFFEVGLTQCLKSDNVENLEACQLEETSEPVEYVVEVWSRPWLNERKVTVKQSTKRKKRGLTEEPPSLGGVSGIPVDDEIRGIAQEGLNSLEANSNSLYRQKIIRVKSATSQVVAGSLTKVFFEVGLTQCLKSDNVENLEACQLEETSEPVEYVVEVWSRPWLNERKVTVKQSTKRKKRGLTEEPPSLGGVSGIPVDDEIRGIAQEGLNSLEANSNSLYRQKVIRVKSATSQVVAGSLTKVFFELGLTQCLKSDNVENLEACQLQEISEPVEYVVEVWSRPWLNERKVTVKQSTDRKKRGLTEEPSSFGGVSGIPVDDEIRGIAQEGLNSLEANSNSLYRQKVIRVKSATGQVVAGSLTKVFFEVGLTQCLKSDNVENLEACQLQETSEPVEYVVEVWSRPWLNERKVTVKQSTDRKRRGLTEEPPSLGGVSGIPVNDEIREIAREGLNSLEANSNSLYRQKVIRVKSATGQVVAGSLTKVFFEVGLTQCLKSDNVENLEACQLQETSEPVEYVVEVWSRPWLNERQVTVKQSNDRKKRGLTEEPPSLGGVSGIPVDDEIRGIAQEGLNSLEANSNSLYRQKVIRVKSATSQVVAGSLTKVLFDVGLTLCLKSDNVDNLEACQLQETSEPVEYVVEVWNRPWLNERKVTVKQSTERKKRGLTEQPHLLGGVTGIPVDDEIMGIAQEGLNSLEANSNSLYRQKVVRVKSATSQVVAGSLTKVFFEVGLTQCLKSDSVKNQEACQLQETSEPVEYVVEVWNRPWLKERKVTVKQSTDRKKRGVPEGFQLAGGEADIPIDDEIRGIAHEGFEILEGKSNSLYRQKLVKVKSATTQVVAGSITRVFIEIGVTECLKSDNVESLEACQLQQANKPLDYVVKVLNIPWLNERQVTIEKVTDRNKRQTSKNERRLMLGEAKSVPIDKKILQMAKEGLNKIEKQNSSPHFLNILRVKSATEQAVSGVLTRVVLELGVTKCLKIDSEINVDECEFLENTTPMEYTVKIWDRPWLPYRQVSIEDFAEANDIEAIEESPMVDGQIYVPVDEEIRQMVADALKTIEANSKSHYRLKIITVKSATVQVVGGTLTRVVFQVRLTKCLKSEDIKNLELCEVQEKDEPIELTAEVWDRPWLPDRQITVNNVSPTGETVMGGEYEVPIDDEIRDIAEEALAILETKSNSLYHQKIITVKSASSQIVEGTLTRVVFAIGLTNCLKSEWPQDLIKCELQANTGPMEYVAEVWDRPWLPDRQITVNEKMSRSKREIDDVILAQSLNKPKPSNFYKFPKRTVDSWNRGLNDNESTTILELTKHSLKHIEVKYPHSYKQEITNILSVKNRNLSGVQYEIQFEVGFTDCLVLDSMSVCNLTDSIGPRKQCNSIVKPMADGSRRVHVNCLLEDEMAESVHLSHLVKASRLFRQFLLKHNRDYVDNRKEMYRRFNIFRANLDIIDQLNLNEQGTATYGVNHFADVSPTEFRSKYLGLRLDLKDGNAIPMRNAEIPDIDVPKAFDWRDEGAVTEVKNQGICGSCWAFSVTGNVEGQWKIKKGKLVSLSEQELVDCDKLDDGCNGGLPDNAYRAIEQLGGLETEQDYPYEGDDEKCHFNKTLSSVQISGAVNISSNETDMVKWLAQNGPISIGINANAMQFYMGGISHPWKILCNPKNLDHGVLIVGYGVTTYPLFNKTMPFWTIKNSWGDSWGESGYYRVFRGDGTCGVNNMASSAVV